MNLEKLQELWKEDCVIDSDLYCEESIRFLSYIKDIWSSITPILL